ncbi:MAG: hypothetical protein SVX43_13435 [Cyanobacteriota bacterium]|nr:hypothetical protein [Cyanobacteriota bacterium]
MELISGFIGTYLRLSEDEEEEFQQTLERMDLGTKERVMQFVTDWQEKGRQEGLLEGRQEGLLEGRQEGLLEGQREGLLEGQRGAIVRILEVRFEEIPQELREQIGRIDDLEALGMLLVQAITIASLEEFSSVASQYVVLQEEELSEEEEWDAVDGEEEE